MVLYARNVSPSFYKTGLFLFFGICCLSALKLTYCQPGAVGDLYYLGTGYFSGGVPDGRHFGGTSEPCGHRRPVAVCLLPGQKSGRLYRGSGRRRVWRLPCWPGYFTAPCLRNLKRCIIWCVAAWKACSWPVYSVPTRRLSSASGMRRWWRW